MRLIQRIAHNDDAVASVVASSATLIAGHEDGTLLVVDLRTHGCTSRARPVDDESINALTLLPGRSDCVLMASSRDLLLLDLRNLSSPVNRCTHNVDEINHVAADPKGRYVATADDSGQVQVMELNTLQLHKSLSSVHTNMCSCTSFRRHRPHELLSGGFDSRVVRWDFQKGRALDRWQMDMGEEDTQHQVFNPPFVHSLAVPHTSQRPYTHFVAVARGDGIVEVFDADNDAPSSRSRSQQPHIGQAVKLSQAHGGHSHAASGVCFTDQGQGKQLVSCGDDRKLCLWDWTVAVESGQQEADNDSPLLASVTHRSKLNCITTAAASHECVVVGDVRGSLTLYSIDT